MISFKKNRKNADLPGIPAAAEESKQPQVQPTAPPTTTATTPAPSTTTTAAAAQQPKGEPLQVVFTTSKRKSNSKHKKTNLGGPAPPAKSVDETSTEVEQKNGVGVAPVDDSDDEVIVLGNQETSPQQNHQVASASVVAVSRMDSTAIQQVAAATKLSIEAVPFFPSFAQQQQAPPPPPPPQYDERYYERMAHETHRQMQERGHVMDDDDEDGFEMDPEAYGDDGGKIFMYEDSELDSDQEEWLLEQMMHGDA